MPEFVCEPEGQAGCVLIRAIEPLTGIETMFKRRAKTKRVQDLASGPGKLTQALAITRKLNGSSLVDGPITVRRLFDEPTFKIDVTPRDRNHEMRRLATAVRARKIELMLKSTIFREYDIRGIAESELLSPDIELLGRGLGTYIRRHSGGKRINLGRDCRLSSRVCTMP